MSNTTRPRMRSMFNLAYDRDFFDCQMDATKGKGRKNLFLKTWERCRSIRGASEKSPSKPLSIFPKSKSWRCTTRSPKDNTKIHQVAPQGCFSVYVGSDKERFVMKTKYANHPLFRMLLEDAEMEYGYSSEGPLLLPCDVDLFCKVLAEMDSKEEIVPSWGFAYGSCSPFSPYRRLGKSSMAKGGSGSYGRLTPSPLLKMNSF